MVRMLERIENKDYAGEGQCVETDDTRTVYNGETALWQAVITQALMDAGSHSTKREMRYDQAQARAWLSGTSEDFHEVCTRAGLHPDYVRQKAQDAITRGCAWRKELSNARFRKSFPVKLHDQRISCATTKSSTTNSIVA